MKFIEEVVVEEFLPTYRSMLAEALRERGLTQHEVAELLGISQSAVSKYVHGEIDRNEQLLADDQLQALVDRLAEGLASGETSPVQALVEAEVLVRKLERGGPLARLHEEAVPELASYGDDRFAVHDPDSAIRESQQVRASLRRGLRILEATDGFAGHIPAVGSNLVECLPDATHVEDVAAVPGRILSVKGAVSIPSDPEFGASEYVATVLLAARDAGSDARAALNLRYDPELVDRLAERGRRPVEFDAERDVEDAIADALADFGPDDNPDVLYQTGGFGVEPIVYVLGPDAPTVATVVREL